MLFPISTMFYWFSLYTYVPVFTPHLKLLGSSLFMSGLIVGSYGITQFLFRVPLGVWSDRIRKRKLFVVLSIVIATISTLLMTFTSNLWVIFFLRSLAGVAASGWVVFSVLYAAYFPTDQLPRAMGLLKVYASMGQMAATALAGILVQFSGWNMPYYVGALGGMVALFSAWLIKEEVPNPLSLTPAIKISEVWRIGSHKSLLFSSLLGIVLQAITFSTLYGFIPLYAERIGVTGAGLSMLMFGSILSNVLAAYIGGVWFVRWMGITRVIAVGFVVAALFTAMTVLTHDLGELVLCQVLSSFGQGLSAPMLMSLALQSVDTSRRATAMGFYQSMYSIGIVGGPLIVGILYAWIGLRGGFLVIAGLGLMAAGFSFA